MLGRIQFAGFDVKNTNIIWAKARATITHDLITAHVCLNIQ
jgi:hypothetical protein